MKTTHEPRPQYFPDGLNEEAIERLIAALAAEVTEAAPPTSALINGGAGERRRRRIERRALTGMVRSFPAVPSITDHLEDIAS
ncbi:MAG TPA: hypothetical protein VIQ30_26945 [Pseudonocardia sp.]